MAKALSTQPTQERTLVQVECPHQGGTHRISCHVWGPAGAPVVLCMPGPTRNAYDFDVLARRLCDRYRVACVELPGRGDSDRLPDSALYGDETYFADTLRAMDELALDRVRWIGTSLGGVIGMKLAAMHPQRFAALVLLDVGASLDGVELSRLRDIARQEQRFASYADAEAFYRERYLPFGPMDESRWRTLIESSITALPGGGYRPKFDLGALRSVPIPPYVDYWPFWEKVRCPSLVIRGEQSRMLAIETCEAMMRTGPRAKFAEIPGAGHAPDVSLPPVLAAIEGFLASVR
jgi:pimeloyl-ACP methyl ester carboxylesterase